MLKKLYWGASLISMVFANNAIAGEKDNINEETIVITASRKETLLSKVPATISKITADDIEKNLVSDIKDLVKYEPGISVKRQPARFGAALGSTGRAGNEGFTIRGIGGNRVLIQVDGIRIPDGFSFGAQNVGRGDYADLGLVKSVEILRGPNSAIYGSDALAGAVSLITSDINDFIGSDKNFGGLVRATYNSDNNEFAKTLILAKSGDKLSSMISVTQRDFNELENMGKIGGNGSLRTIANPQDGDSLAIMAKANYQINDNHKLRISAENIKTNLASQILSGLSASVDKLTSHDTSERSRASLELISKFDGVLKSAHYNLFWQTSKDSQFTDEDRSILADRERLNTFNNEVYGLSTDFNAQVANHSIVFGGDISKTNQSGIRDGVTPPFGETFPTKAFPDTDFTLGGIFLIDDYSLNNLIISTALRYDFYDLKPKGLLANSSIIPKAQDGSRFSPKIGAIYKFENGISVYGNWGEGFKSPEPSQVNQFFENIAQGYTSIPNSDLKPETNQSYEMGLRYKNGGLSTSLAAFNAKYKNFIEQIYIGGTGRPGDLFTYQYRNLNRVEINGLEAQLNYKRKDGVGLKLAISYADGNEFDENSVKSPLYSIDPLKIILGFGYNPKDKPYGGEISVTSFAQKSADDTNGLCSTQCYRPKAFAILDLTTFYRISKSLTLRAAINNIGDQKYSYWNDVRGISETSSVLDAYTQPGRNFAISITKRF